MNLTAEEREDITISLNMRCNFIETGDTSLSAVDVQNMGDYAPKDAKIKALHPSQMEAILRMKKLIQKLYNA